MKLNKNNVKLAVRGALNPSLVRLRGRQFDASDALTVFGCFRSGTTWLAELLATVPGTGVLFEPTAIRHLPEAREAGFHFRNYQAPGTSWPAGESYLDKVFSGHMLNYWTTCSLPVSNAWAVQRWIVKIVGSNTLLGWITERFRLNRPVLIIRHPCAVLASRLSRGWGNSSVYLEYDRPFLELHPEYRAIFEHLKTPTEVITAQWCMDHLEPMLLPRPVPFQLVCYERLVTDGLDHLRPVLETWNLQVNDAMEERFRRPSTKASEDFRSDSLRLISSWRRKLDPDQIRQVLWVVKAFGLDFYGDDPEPDYDRLFSDTPLRPPGA